MYLVVISDRFDSPSYAAINFAKAIDDKEVKVGKQL